VVMAQKYYFKKMTTATEIEEFWKQKRKYEKLDIFPNVKETGKELEELIHWFQSEEYYNRIMDLHRNVQQNGSGLHFVFIYDNKNEYIGFIMYKIYTQEDGKCFILDFSIDSKHRNKKVGTQVVAAFESLVKENEGATYFALNTSNDNNKRFWKRQGFYPSEVDEYGEILYLKK